MNRTHPLPFLVLSLLATTPTACRRSTRTPTPPRASPPTPPTTNTTNTTSPSHEPAATEDDADLTRDLASELARAFQRESVPASVEGTRVRALDHVFTAHARVLQVIEEEMATAAIDVAFDLDGRPEEAFHVTAIAHDRNRAEALQHAIREWSVANGIPMVQAMRPRDAASSDGGVRALRLGRYDVFAGPMGARGEVPPDWDARANGINAALVARLEPELARLLPESASRYRGLRYTMHIRGGAGGEGDCRVDNVENEHLCELIRTYAWPHIEGETEGYIVKQYLVLTSPAR
jgi:hypothetical protein